MHPTRTLTALVATIAATSLLSLAAHAQSTSKNSGSLGTPGDGTNTAGVVIKSPGAVGPGGGVAAYYSGGSQTTPVNTTLPYKAALNPASAANPFTIEFWVNPTNDVTDNSGPAPVFNRVSTGNRSGWVFFQRGATQGWNFALYNGNSSDVGKQVTGGTYTPGTWSHVVAVWDGANPSIYVNGVNTNAPVISNASNGTGLGYNPSTTATFSVGSYDTGANPFTGAVDETAFYAAALTPAQILAHFNAASNASTYSSLVLADGAVEYLRNDVPEPTTASLLALGLFGLRLTRRPRRV
jgi:hypothetical protein